MKNMWRKLVIKSQVEHIQPEMKLTMV